MNQYIRCYNCQKGSVKVTIVGLFDKHIELGQCSYCGTRPFIYHKPFVYTPIEDNEDVDKPVLAGT